MSSALDLTSAGVWWTDDGRHIELQQITQPPASPATKDKQTAALGIINPGSVLSAQAKDSTGLSIACLRSDSTEIGSDGCKTRLAHHLRAA